MVQKTIAFKSLGCKLNQYEVQALREGFLREGFREVPWTAKPDFCVLNTCTVTEKADQEARRFIRSWARFHPGGRMIVTGCYAEAQREEIESFPGVSLVVGNKSKNQILYEVTRSADAIEAPSPFFERGISYFEERSRAFVKIQDGCNYFCGFCKIPYVRGRLVSRPSSQILDEVKRLVESGYKEIVLSGVCLGSYGRDTPEGPNLVGLLEGILSLGGHFRVRLSSIDPRDTMRDLAALMAGSGRLCPHLHLSLQSGDDGVLRRMRRGYTVQEFRGLVDFFYSEVPRMGFSTDVIVGYPGEDELAFQNTLRLLREVRFHRVHVFPYSERKGTRAVHLDGKVPAGVLKERVRFLRSALKDVTQKFIEGFLGETLTVLAEHKRTPGGGLAGLTENYIRCVFSGSDESQGRLVKVRMMGRNGEALAGEEVYDGTG